MEQEDTDDTELTRIEQTLLMSLALPIVRFAGALVTANRYPAVTPEQFEALRNKIERVLTGTIIGMREPGPPATADELLAVTNEVAVSVVLAVLGDPPGSHLSLVS